MAAGKPATTVVISATDRVTEKIDAINRKLASMRAPGEKLQKSLGKLGQLSGLSRIGGGFGKIAGFARGAFLEVSRILTPLGAITGAATLAGMVRLTTAWADFGSRLGFTAQRIGVSSAQLMGLQGAARLAGSSAGGLDSGLQQLGQNMWDAVGGRAPAVVSAFRMLHVSFQNADGSAKSVAEVMPQLADRIAAVRNPYAQAALAAQFFGGAAEDMLPFLRLGSQGMADYQRKAVAYGVINARGVAAANQLRIAQASLTMSVEGLGYAIAEELAPVITPVVQRIADWIAQNRTLIATKLHAFLDLVVGKAKALWKVANDVATALGGWSTVAEVAKVGLELLFAGKMISGLMRVLGILRMIAVTKALMSLPAPVLLGGLAIGAGVAGAAGIAAALGFAYKRGGAKLSGAALDTLSAQSGLNRLDDTIRGNIARHQAPLRPEQFSRVAGEDMADWQRRGYTRTQASILEGNLAQESGLNPYATNKQSGAFGLAQWLGGRARGFRDVEGVDLPYATRAQQRDYVDWELHHTEASSGRLLRSLTSTDQAAAFGRSYERYGAGEEGNRVAYAGGFAATPPVAVPAPIGAAGAQKLEIEVAHKNAPPGAQVKVTRKPDDARVAVRTERAMRSDMTRAGV